MAAKVIRSLAGTGARLQNCSIWKIHASNDSDFFPENGGGQSGLMRGWAGAACAAGLAGIAMICCCCCWISLCWLMTCCLRAASSAWRIWRGLPWFWAMLYWGSSCGGSWIGLLGLGFWGLLSSRLLSCRASLGSLGFTG